MPLISSKASNVVGSAVPSPVAVRGGGNGGGRGCSSDVLGAALFLRNFRSAGCAALLLATSRVPWSSSAVRTSALSMAVWMAAPGLVSATGCAALRVRARCRGTEPAWAAVATECGQHTSKAGAMQWQSKSKGKPKAATKRVTCLLRFLKPKENESKPKSMPHVCWWKQTEQSKSQC